MARSLLGVAAGGALAVALAVGVIPALADPVAGSSLGAPASVAAGQPFTLEARFVRGSGALLQAGVAVIFSQTSAPASPCAARFDPQFTVTDATGAASARVTLPAGCPGAFVLAATAAGGGSVTARLTETGGGFPDTTAAPTASPAVAGAPVARRI
jgi:hypothetical protein